jgi:uncharacterized membrane protein
MDAQFPAVTVAPGEDVTMDLIFTNRGRSDETVEFWIEEQPEGWMAAVKTYRYAVAALYVPAGEDRTLTFEAEPEGSPQPGDYLFRIAGRTRDGKMILNRTVQVTVREKAEAAKENRGVRLTTSYPVLQGPSDGEFEFSIEVESKRGEDAVFDLLAQVPEGWQVNFKPAYETKFISSLRLKANQSSTVAVQVKPPPRAGTGNFPINVKVQSGDAAATVALTVILTGTYELEVGTPTGLLSLDARPGEPSTLSFYVKNTGSAANNSISFMSFKPENWKTVFKPETLSAINPGELQQVEVEITPNRDALVGDYAVSVRVDGERATKNMELRVTVKASAAWAWVGIAVILAVVAGLAVMFKKLGRR